MLSWRKPFLPWATLLLVLALAGCGDGSNLVPVTGTLTYKGNPVTNAYIDFTPEQGRPSWGQTDDQGRFKLEYDGKHKGAVVGKHKVSVRVGPQTTADREPGMAPPQSKEMAAFFDKYSFTNSKIEVVIDKNTKDLKLVWD